MKNSIAERVSDFLKDFPPFNLLKEKSLLEIAGDVNIIYLEKGDVLYQKGDHYHEYFYIVRNGAVSLFHHASDDNTKHMVNINDAGDIFGVRPLINREDYKLTAIANEESIVYGIPIDVFEAVTNKNVKVYKYLITSFASNAYDPYTAEENTKIFVDYLPNTSQDIVNFQSANYTKNPIYCKA
ncbi:MAG TPA: cyclic nucleotide-binding domain-containing protein, partial [Flavobacteriaceae bacterium]|nr:cyclic nucleotide-binding domain-containing protein [Flavobacteriaceae bacterium]